MKGLTARQIRKSIARASEGYERPTRRVLFPVKFRHPRLYDDYTDFEDVKEHSGVYIIYCLGRPRTPQTRYTRILYIGRGWVGGRLLYHKLNKRGLAAFARQHTVKFTFCPLHNVDAEFVVEGILLNEHHRLVGAKPYFTKNKGSKTLHHWHDVMSMRPGPKRILKKYGAKLKS
jgi:hypothetical protein